MRNFKPHGTVLRVTVKSAKELADYLARKRAASKRKHNNYSKRARDKRSAMEMHG